jgi:hypothetical protein
MVQHADRFYEVEGLVDGSQPQNVSLCVFDVHNAQLARLSLREGEACCTEIDGQNPRRRKSLRRLDRLLPGTATRYEHIDPVILTREARGSNTELARQEGLGMPSFEGDLTHLGYGFSSYWLDTNREVSSSIGVNFRSVAR